MSTSNISHLYALMTGVMGGLALAHFTGEDRLEDIIFWLAPVWLLLSYHQWRSDNEEKSSKDI